MPLHEPQYQTLHLDEKRFVADTITQHCNNRVRSTTQNSRSKKNVQKVTFLMVVGRTSTNSWDNVGDQVRNS
jgi:hypothetical protein